MSPFESRCRIRRKSQLTEYGCRMRQNGTPSEQVLWAAIQRGAAGVVFRRQVPIAGSFIGDFVASEIKLVVEVDGGYHAARRAADARRDQKLQRLGYTVLRLSAELVEHQLPLALQHIRVAIGQLTGRGGIEH